MSTRPVGVEKSRRTVTIDDFPTCPRCHKASSVFVRWSDNPGIYQCVECQKGDEVGLNGPSD
jgi:hypothetical protein